MNAEALFRFDYAVRGIDFWEGMVGLCRKGIVRLLTYFKRRYGKIERKWGENDNHFFECDNYFFECDTSFFENGTQLFECDTSFFECDTSFFLSDHQLFENDPSLFENDRNFFESDTSFFERAESFLKMTQAFPHLTQVLAHERKGGLFGNGCGSSLLHDLGTMRMRYASKIREKVHELRSNPLVMYIDALWRIAYALSQIENPYVFAASGMANADLSYDLNIGRLIK